MALPKKDVRPYFDADIHAAMKLFAEADGYGDGIASWIETVITDIVRKRVHTASLIVSSLEASGALRSITEDKGKSA